MPSRRHFGSIRKLPSGRYQASYWHQDQFHLATHTFPTKGDAQAWLSAIETDINRGTWLDPDRHKIRPVADAATRMEALLADTSQIPSRT